MRGTPVPVTADTITTGPKTRATVRPAVKLTAAVVAVVATWMLTAPDPGQEPASEPVRPHAPVAAPVEPAAVRTVTAYLTGYSWYDNTPAGSPEISHPRRHQTAGGTGTYADPITVAVGHSLATGRDVLDWPAGTRFYFPTLQRYGIAEDTCGDGPRPELGACHRHARAVATHLDVWIGGQGGTRKATDACMERLTGNVPVEVNPPAGRVVRVGAVWQRGRCDLP